MADNAPYRVNCTFLNNSPGGIPLPEITWYDSTGTLITDDVAERIHVEGSYLVFKRIRGSDVGDYTCRANNMGGEKETQLSIELAGE